MRACLTNVHFLNGRLFWGVLHLLDDSKLEFCEEFLIMYLGAPNSTALQSTVECFILWLLVDGMSCNFATWQSYIFLKPIKSHMDITVWHQKI